MEFFILIFNEIKNWKQVNTKDSLNIMQYLEKFKKNYLFNLLNLKIAVKFLKPPHFLAFLYFFH